jgi:nicotinate phosphoribosyltransferase
MTAEPVTDAAVPTTWHRSALFTDLYQLLMAQLYVVEGIADRPAQFDYFYRSNPDYGSHQAGFCVFAGLEPLMEWMSSTAFTSADLDALGALRDQQDRPQFCPEFLDWLSVNGHFRDLEVRGFAEGRVVHPNTPMLTVTGPLAAAQLLETALLNQCNYPTLVATKAALIVQSAQGGAVLEFGMRRGPGAGVDEAARAAVIGGCVATSNVQASVVLGTAPKGTHAHSMVQAYLATGAGELEAFRAFARRYPDDCILLVDTVDTLHSGVPNAITVFRELREQGHEPIGIRLDSGDLAHLAVESARMLDAAGFENAGIVLSGDLDEMTIWQILTQIDDEARRGRLDGAAIRRRLSFGVGTKLITSEGQPALGGVYKLTAIADDDGHWQPALKLSDSPVKVPIIGPKRCWRLYDRRGLATADLMTEVDEVPFDGADRITLHHPFQAGVQRQLSRDDVERVEEVHEVVFDGSAPPPRTPITELRQRCREDIERLDPGVRRLVNPHVYHVSLSSRLHARQNETVARLRGTV